MPKQLAPPAEPAGIESCELQAFPDRYRDRVVDWLSDLRFEIGGHTRATKVRANDCNGVALIGDVPDHSFNRGFLHLCERKIFAQAKMALRNTVETGIAPIFCNTLLDIVDVRRDQPDLCERRFV